MPTKTLLIGPAGTGKTYVCLKTFTEILASSKDPLEPDVWLILPSQEHVRRVRDLLLSSGVRPPKEWAACSKRGLTPSKKGSDPRTGRGLTPPFKILFNRHVLTINDFVLLLRERGRQELISKVGRLRFVREILESGSFETLSRLKKHKGLFHALTDLISELQQGLVSPMTFAAAVRKSRSPAPVTALKLKELSRLYQEYQRCLKSARLSDEEDELLLLVRSLEKRLPPILKPTHHLLFDGFFDFTAAQEALILALSQKIPQTTVTLTYEKDRERAHLFETPCRCFKRFVEAGFRVQALPHENWRTRSQALILLERNLFREKLSPMPETPDEITIFEASGMRAEMEMIAREIRKLSAMGEYPWSDFAVILRTIDPYEKVLRSTFSRFGIPVEVHERKWLAQNAVVGWVVNFLRIFKEGWKRDDLIRFLKSSYGPFDFREMAELEIEVRQLGILAGKEAWTRVYEEARFNSRRKEIVAWLEAYETAFLEARTLAEWVKVLRKACLDFGILDHGFSEDEKTREDLAAWKVLDRILDDLIEGEARGRGSGVSFQEAYALLLQAIEIALFPVTVKGKNLVQVYDVSLARQKEYRVVFLAGLVEKVFPIEIREDPCLRDEERRRLQREGLRLEERLPKRATERYLFYLGVTRAVERLYLTYPKYDVEGRDSLASFYLEEVKRCFAKVPEKRIDISEVMPPLQDLTTRREAENYLVFHFWEKRLPKLSPLADFYSVSSFYNRFLGSDQLGQLLQSAFRRSGVLHDSRILGVLRRFEGPFHATMLESFGKCPYRFFAEHILGLEGIREGLDDREVGGLLHRVLQQFYEEAKKKRRKGIRITKEALDRWKPLLREKLAQELAKNEFRGTERYRMELKKCELAELVDRFLDREVKFFEKRSVEPEYFEMAFGSEKGGLPPLEIRVGTGLDRILLSGRIDRIDIDATRKRALVVDYKLGRSFEEEELREGTTLQLPLYALAVQELMGLAVVGAEFYSLKSLQRKGFYREEEASSLFRGNYAGLKLTGEAFDEVLARALLFVTDYVRRIREGDIATEPKTCEKFCSYNQVCRIEKWRLKYIDLERKRKEGHERTHALAEGSRRAAG